MQLDNNGGSMPTFVPANEQEAWIAVFFAVMAADKVLSAIEVNTVSRYIVLKELFVDYNVEASYEKVMRAQQQMTSKLMIDAATPGISEDNRKTVMAIACDIVMADGILSQEENQLLTYLGSALSLNVEDLTRIVDVIFIKNKGNKVVVD